jgi:hypothetical protein
MPPIRTQFDTVLFRSSFIYIHSAGGWLYVLCIIPGPTTPHNSGDRRRPHPRSLWPKKSATSNSKLPTVARNRTESSLCQLTEVVGLLEYLHIHHPDEEQVESVLPSASVSPPAARTATAVSVLPPAACRWKIRRSSLLAPRSSLVGHRSSLIGHLVVARGAPFERRVKRSTGDPSLDRTTGETLDR